MIAVHEISHAIASGSGSGLLVRLTAEDWEYRPDKTPEAEQVILCQLAGSIGERVNSLGIEGATALLAEDPSAFFHTECASPEDLVFVIADPETCAGLVVKHKLISKIAMALNEIGPVRIHAFAACMAGVQIGDGMRLDGLPVYSVN